MNRHRELAQMMRAAAGPPPDGIPTDGLYHWLKLDQETGSTILNYGSNGESASVRRSDDVLHTTGWRFDAILERWVYYADDAFEQHLKLPSFALPFPVTMVFHAKNNNFTDFREYAYDQESPRTVVTLSGITPATTVEVYNGTWLPAGVEQLAAGVWGQQAVFMTENSLQVVNDNGNGDVIASSVGTGSTTRALFGKYSGSVDNAPDAVCADFLLYSRILSAGELAAIRVAVLGS